ncbi:hypothetical protein TNCV_3556311 [Trichonephila clavipes]|nr:hypothetical protein TNCV_3556311 [Trichonephila clavipes]
MIQYLDHWATAAPAARFRIGHLKSKKFFKESKSFEICTNGSSEPTSPADILECLGLTKQDLADDPWLV